MKKPVVIITGASSGIGREFAKQLNHLVSKNAAFILNARREERLDELQQELTQREVIKLVGDITSESIQKKLLLLIEEKQLEVLWLVNNAGFGLVGKFSEMPVEQLKSMSSLNAVTPALLIRQLVGSFASKAYVANITSSAAFAPLGYFAFYSATKVFLHYLSVGIYQEMKQRGVHVSSVCPGPVKTEFFDVASANEKQRPPAFVMEDVEKTVENAIKGTRKGRPIVTTGPFPTLFRFLSKIGPQARIARSTRAD